jgi:hypothetical protein
MSKNYGVTASIFQTLKTINGIDRTLVDQGLIYNNRTNTLEVKDKDLFMLLSGKAKVTETVTTEYYSLQAFENGIHLIYIKEME